MVREQKTDTRDARHILRFADPGIVFRGSGCSPLPNVMFGSWSGIDTSWCVIRTSVMNQLHALAMGQRSLPQEAKALEPGGPSGSWKALTLDPWASRRWWELFELLLDQLRILRIQELDRAVISEAESRPAATLFDAAARSGASDRAGVRVDRRTGEPLSANSKKLVSYLGLNPSEESSGGRQRLGAISKQGNTILRCLLVEAAQTAARFDPELRRDSISDCSFVAELVRVAKVAHRTKVGGAAVSWKLREVAQPVPFSGSHAGQPAQLLW